MAAYLQPPFFGAHMTNSNTLNPHVMPSITFLALVPLVYFIPDFIGQYLPEGKLLNVAVAVGIIVPIISYGVIPLMLNIIHRMGSK